MIISVETTLFRVPGRGEVQINQLEVRVSAYTLGVSAQGFYDLQTRETVTKTREVIDAAGNAATEEFPETVTTSYGLNGNDSLTESQFAGWGNDDVYFADCIAQNLGLTPVK